MLSPNEMKIVLATLTQRRAYLVKGLEQDNIPAETRNDQISTIKYLDSSLQKISKLVTPKSSQDKTAQVKTAPPPALPVIKKSVKKQAIALSEAYILIAEDNADSASLLKSVLEDMDVKNIDIVEDGRAAVRALENCSPPYDVVLCDWDMPELTGLEVRKAIKPLAKLRDTHFIMVTANSESSRIREAIMNGVNDYIVKPIDIEILEAKLKAALAGEPQKKEEMIVSKK